MDRASACGACSSGFDSRNVQKNFLGGRKINGTRHDKNCMMRSLQVALSSRPNVKYAQGKRIKNLVSELFYLFGLPWLPFRLFFYHKATFKQ